MKRYFKMFVSLMAGVIILVTFSHTAYALEIGARAYYWFPTFRSDLRAGDGGTKVDVRDVLGVGYEYYPSIEAFAGIGKHHLSFMYTPIDYSGSTTLLQDVVFRGKTYASGNHVETDLKFMMLDLEYQYDLINMENILAGFSLGAIGKIKYLDGEAKLNDPSLGYDEKETFQIPIPMVGLGAHIGILANILEARAKLTGIGYSGNVIYEGMADVSWTPFPFIDLHGGYKIIKIDVDESGVYLNSEFYGPYVAVTVGF